MAGGERVNNLALRDLVQRQRETLGLSYGDIAEASGLPRSTVYYLATERLKRSPSPATITALARGLQLPFELVRDAAAVAVGLSVEAADLDDPALSVLIASVHELTPDEREHVLALVRSILQRR